MEAAERICKNCKFFKAFDDKPDEAMDVETGEKIRAGRRDCNAKNVAWGDSPCVTGQFKPQEPQGRIIYGIGGTLCQPKEKG